MKLKNYQDKIDLLLKGELSRNEKRALKEEAHKNPELKELIDQQILALQALEVNWAKSSWAKSAVRWLVIKVAVAALIILGSASVLMWSVNSKSKNKQDNSQENLTFQPNEITVDSSSANSINLIDSLPIELPAVNSLVTHHAKAASCGTQEPKIESKSDGNDTKLLLSSNPGQEVEVAKLVNLQDNVNSQYQRVFRGFERLENNAQVFQFNAQKDEVIVGQYQTKIAFPAGTIVDTFGREVKGLLKLKLVEFNSMGDLIEQGLSTQTKDGVLSTAGSCYIMIYDSLGQQCKVAKNKEYTVEFNSTYDPNMQSYTGQLNDTGIIWNAGIETKIAPVMVSDEDLHAKPSLKIINNKERGIFSDAPRMDRSSRYCFNLKAVSMNEEDKLMNKALNDSMYSSKAFHYFDKFRNFDQRLAYDLYRKMERTLEADTLKVHYQITENGELVKYSFDKSLKGKVKRRLKKFVKRQGKEKLFEDWNEGARSFTLYLFPGVNYTNSERLAMKTDSMLAEENAALKTIQFEKKNTLSFRNLGFVNCDKPYNPNKYTDVFLSASAMVKGYVYVVIDKGNALMKLPLNGGKFRIEKGTKVTLVAIIKEKDGVKMSIQRKIKPGVFQESVGVVETFNLELIKRAVD